MLDPNDHRSLGRRLDLFHFEEDAPGMAFWHPRGLVLYRLLEEACREQSRALGYREVRTPQLVRKPVWDASGHWQHFHGNMFRVDDAAADAALKPVNCPGHILIAQKSAPSYRDLPMRLAELGVVHRDEPGGTLHGLLRLRQFTQDDGHVFCAEADAEEEVARFLRVLPSFYGAFGFERMALAFSTRPASRAGDEAAWDRAEAILKRALDASGRPYGLQPGEGAFYGPKIEISLEDRQGRSWQCGTIQLDLVMPERFGFTYVDAGGARRTPAMLHRAFYGSLERFLGMLLEFHGASLPAWLTPTQVRVVVLTDDAREAARAFHRELDARGLRADVVDGGESLARRIAEAHEDAVPFVAVLGRKEVESGAVSLRSKGGVRSPPLGEAVGILAAACARPRFA